jgi:FAD:protein FMN transferase
MLASLQKHGVKQAMIAAGGDIRVGAPPPGRDGWRVAVQTFDREKHDEILMLCDASVSTSGDLHQMVEINGVCYSHIVDPATGLGLTRRTAAVVIADQGEISDPLATALCVLGENGAEPLRKRKGVREIKVRPWQDCPLDSSKIHD